MWNALQIVVVLLIGAATLGGAVLVLAMIGSFINRIGNPYDKW